MSTAEMQACLARLYVDEPFRRLFFLDPAAIGEYWLSQEEVSAIRAIDHTMLDYYAGSLRNKRRGRIERAYPMLFALDREKLIRYYARYYQLHPGRSGLSPQQDVADFGIFLEESLMGADTLPPYAADIARYERLYYKVRFSSHPAATDAEDAPRRIAVDGDAPYLRSGVEIADFDYDMTDVEERLQDASRASAAPDLSANTIAFLPPAGAFPARMLRLNAAARAVLDRCDGRGAGDIVAELEAVFGARNLRADIVAALDRLLALNVLTLNSRLTASTGAARHAYGMSESEGL